MKGVLAAIAMLAAVAFAQPQHEPWSEQAPVPEQPEYGTPPGGPNQAPQSDSDPGVAEHGVARISFMNGNVSVRRGDSADLIAAVVNAPLTIGDRVVTGDGGRAEVQLDYANFFRLAPGTEVRLSELQRGRYQIQIAAGTIVYRVLRDSNAQVEISTPSISVRPMHAGVYRINVNPDGITEITLRNGADGEVFGPRGSEQIHNGSTMMVRGSSNDPEFQVVSPSPEDEFDRWSASRDQALLRATSPGRVNRDIYGTEDMDAYGHWVNDGAYGQVWVPSVAPGWAPYACGRWVWIDYYGWTWLGCEPWAWAPYHFGRWYFGSFGWAWWPGPIYGGVFWRPALVGFFGWGAGVGVGFGWGFAHVGWVPLAPYEAFHPWWGGAVVRNTVVVNNINVTNVYRNARVTNAVTSVRSGDFGRVGVSNATVVRPGAGELARAGTVNGRLPMSVANESRQFSNARANTAGVPRTAENARFFSSAASRPGGAMNTGGARSAESGAARANGGGGGGWQRINPSGGGNNSSSGWQRFPAGGNNGGAPRGGGQPQVRINPSIVQNPGSQNRGGSPQGGSPSYRSPGGYARPAPSSGGPRNSGGGSPRGGGGSHGGGGRH